MALKNRLNYWSRIFPAYSKKNKSQLSFWHNKPEINNSFSKNKLGQYYMLFKSKAYYSGFFDQNGIPLLNYEGKIGKQYNPIAIAQYGLAHYNIYQKTKDQKSLKIFLNQADWLVNNLDKGLWMHNFNWEYKKELKAPWYSGLAQGQGISVLARAYDLTKDQKYLDATNLAFKSFLKEVNTGGVVFNDDYVWIEEYIVDPPTHILNGFIWAIWGIYDYFLLTQDSLARGLYDSCVKTLKKNLKKYDYGFWSLYDLSRQGLKNIASPFYHQLHIVQLRIMFELTQEPVFKKYALKWKKYQNNFLFRKIALIYKIIFKLIYF